MKHYIWLNPVVFGMYGETQLTEALKAKKYEIVSCKADHIARVKQQYREMVEKNAGCILDMRCPAAAAYVKKQLRDMEEKLIFPKIGPILIQAARELAAALDFSDGSDLTIITPCSELRNLGNEKKLPSVRFLTWREFAAQHDLHLTRAELKESPIPPGFFAEYGKEAVSLASKEEIDSFFAERGYEEKRIAEMLFCPQGCHNGDGV